MHLLLFLALIPLLWAAYNPEIHEQDIQNFITSLLLHEKSGGFLSKETIIEPVKRALQREMEILVKKSREAQQNNLQLIADPIFSELLTATDSLEFAWNVLRFIHGAEDVTLATLRNSVYRIAKMQKNDVTLLGVFCAGIDRVKGLEVLAGILNSEEIPEYISSFKIEYNKDLGSSSESGEDEEEYLGFLNVVNSCFMNSFLQILFRIPKVRDIIANSPGFSDETITFEQANQLVKEIGALRIERDIAKKKLQHVKESSPIWEKMTAFQSMRDNKPDDQDLIEMVKQCDEQLENDPDLIELRRKTLEKAAQVTEAETKMQKFMNSFALDRLVDLFQRYRNWEMENASQSFANHYAAESLELIRKYVGGGAQDRGHEQQSCAEFGASLLDAFESFENLKPVAGLFRNTSPEKKPLTIMVPLNEALGQETLQLEDLVLGWLKENPISNYADILLVDIDRLDPVDYTKLLETPVTLPRKITLPKENGETEEFSLFG